MGACMNDSHVFKYVIVSHGAYIGTLGLMECKNWNVKCYLSLESADPHDSDVLREKI